MLVTRTADQVPVDVKVDEGASTKDRALSHSQLATWLSCEKRWDFTYVDDLQPIQRKDYLSIGTFVHNLLAKAFLAGSDQPIIDAEHDKPLEEEMFLHARRLAYRAYHAFPAGYELAYINGDPAVEIYIETPIPGWKCFRGFIDLVVRDKDTGNYWLVDHKVRKQFTTADQEVVNLQMAAYQHMLTQNGYPTAGSITYQISDKLPATPKINADGAVSRAKIKTDVATYKKAVIDAGHNPDDYADMLFKLAEVKFHDFTKKYRSDQEVANTWDYIVVPTASRISEFVEAGDQIPLRAWNRRECSWCPFIEPCTEEIKGRDTEWIINNGFEQRSGRSGR